MIHAPHCTGGPLVTQKGYSVQIITCQTCHAVSTVRRSPHLSVGDRADISTVTPNTPSTTQRKKA